MYLLHHTLYRILQHFPKVLYAILISPSAPSYSAVGWLRHGLLEKNSIQNRIISLINFFDTLLPGVAKRLSHSLYDHNHFPWKADETELMAYGTGAAVLKVRWGNADKALRIYRRSIGRSAAGRMEIAKHYKQNYERVLAWYGDVPELVLPMEFLILEFSPLMGPVAASLQSYVSGEKYDPFEDFSDAELIKLLYDNNFLREQFVYFAEQTLRQWQVKKFCYDIMGRENIMLVRRNNDYRLHIVDDGFFRFDRGESRSPEKMALLVKRMERLNSLYKAAKS